MHATRREKESEKTSVPFGKGGRLSSSLGKYGAWGEGKMGILCGFRIRVGIKKVEKR